MWQWGRLMRRPGRPLFLGVFPCARGPSVRVNEAGALPPAPPAPRYTGPTEGNWCSRKHNSGPCNYPWAVKASCHRARGAGRGETGRRGLPWHKGRGEGTKNVSERHHHRETRRDARHVRPNGAEPDPRASDRSDRRNNVSRHLRATH